MFGMPESGDAMLRRAMDLAISAHGGQWRDGAAPLPYILHPMDVMNRLRYVGGVTDVDVLAAGILHDVLEETEITIEKLTKVVGKRGTDLVIQVTRYEPTKAETAGLSAEEVYSLRSSILLNEMRTMMSAEAWMIKLADRASNLISAIQVRPKEKLKRYVNQSYQILEIIPKNTNVMLHHEVSRCIALAEARIRELEVETAD